MRLPPYSYGAGPIVPLAQPPDSGGNSVLNSLTPIPFVLDGRYLHAFNGPGMDALGWGSGQRGTSMFANFRVNGNIVTGLANGLAPTAANGSPMIPGNPDGVIPSTAQRQWIRDVPRHG